MAPELPKRVDRYDIIERLGRGGMGVVYLATDPALGRRVAIKMLTEDNEELRERFAREARSAAALKHNNIVTIYDVGEDQGRPFFAMEHLEGENLAEIIRRRAELPVRQKLDWILELCAGLGYAHRAQIVHRDIKPANLLITSDRTLKIVDFGIARVQSEATIDGLTQMGMLVGSPHYMSPEQADGQPVDERSDIFAVGLVVYELLSYERAFPGDTPHVVLSHIMNREPRPILELCPDLDPDLVRIVNRGLVKDRGERYQTLAEMAADLRRIRERLSDGETSASMIDRSAAPIARPQAAVQTPTPGMLDSAALARRRAAEISRHLDDASGSFRAGQYEAAIEHSERVLVINPQEPRAIEILQLTYRAMEARQVRQWLAEAEALKTENALTGAERLVMQALKMQPDSLDAQTSLLDVRERRRQRDRGSEEATLLTDDAGAAAETVVRTVVASPTVAAPSPASPSPAVTSPPQVRHGDGRRLAVLLLAGVMIAGAAGAVIWLRIRGADGPENVATATAPAQTASPVPTSSPTPTSNPAPTRSPVPPPSPVVTSDPVRANAPEQTAGAASVNTRLPANRSETPPRPAPQIAVPPAGQTAPPPAENRREVEAAEARARELAVAEKNRRDALSLLQRSYGAGHADAIELLKQAAALDSSNRDVARELIRRESEAAAEAKRSSAAEAAAHSAIRQVLSQFTQVFNGDNGRKSEGFRKLWPSMTGGDLAALNAYDTTASARDWTGAPDRADIRLNNLNNPNNGLTSATVTWPITLRGRNRGSNLISYEEYTATFEMAGGATWVITRMSIVR